MKPVVLAASLLVAATGANANEFEPALRDFFESNVRTWVSDPVIVSAIIEQNARTAGFSQSDIDALDQSWRAEVGSSNQPTISPVLQNAASEFLRAQVASASGAISEVFAMDARGLNVAASDVTSDYWQGDEAKFSETYPMGPSAMHIGEVEFDESAQAHLGQVSVSVVDPATGEVIGAITVGLNAEALF